MTGDSLQSYTLSPVDDSGSGSTPPGSLEVAPASHKGGTAQQNTAFCVFVLCVFVFVFVFVYLYLCICIFVFAHLGSLEVAAASHKTAHQTTASDKSVFVYLYFAICVFVYLYLRICAVRVLYKGGTANKTQFYIMELESWHIALF